MQSDTPKTGSSRIALTTVLGRGWTRALVERFMPAPDALVENPHYQSAAPMRLCNIDRVEAVEATSDWQDAVQVGAKRWEP